jgi:hypothetical protein
VGVFDVGVCDDTRLGDWKVYLMYLMLNVFDVGLFDVFDVELVIQVMSMYILLLHKVVDYLRRYDPTR